MAVSAAESGETVELPLAEGNLLSVDREARLFWRLRYRVLRSLFRSALSTSRVQLASVALASVLLWLGLYILFYGGFHFVQTGLTHIGLRTQLIHAMFNIFFLALTVMLVFSAAIILYGGLFRSEEVAHLLTTPTRSERIVWHKFQETSFFSCWGFVLLASPMLLAYGAVVGAPWHYYVVLGPFVVSFVLVTAEAGAILCLLVVRLAPSVRMHALVSAAVAVIAVGGFLGWRILAYENRDIMTNSWFQDVLARLEFSEQRLLPSWWLSSGLLEAAHPASSQDGRPAWLESLMFLAVITSNALLLHVALGKTADWSLRPSFSSLHGLGRQRRRRAGSWLDRGVIWVGSPLPRAMRQLLLKDLRLFRRDPLQWSQFAIFLGLLSLYFFNVRRFDYSGVMERWVVLISFFNLAVVGLLLSTFTTRFIFPMISLEGRRFWILGTAPIRRETILWGKFWFAFLGSLVPCSLLVAASDLVLRVAQRSLSIVLIHQVTCCLLCAGLAAMAVGFGAKMPNLRESSPSKIAAGFGGTLNLVLSALYIIVMILLTAVPCFFWGRLFRQGTQVESVLLGGYFGLGTTGSVLLGLALTLLVGIAATAFPLWIGMRAFRRLEF